MTSRTAKIWQKGLRKKSIDPFFVCFIVQGNSADTTLPPSAHLQHCQLSTLSCKHQRRTIKHSIGPTTCSAHNGSATINSLYFTTAHPLKVSEREQAIVWLRQAFIRTAGISSHAQSFRSALSGPCWPAGGLRFWGNQEPKYKLWDHNIKVTWNGIINQVLITLFRKATKTFSNHCW